MDPFALPLFAPLPCLRVSALGAELAFEAARIEAAFALTREHATARRGAGLVMLYEGAVIPLVDLRAPAAKSGALAGAAVLVAVVHGRRFALAVDRVKERFAIGLDELRLPDEALAARSPCLVGGVWRDGAEVCLIDADRLLGAAIRQHLPHAGLT